MIVYFCSAVDIFSFSLFVFFPYIGLGKTLDGLFDTQLDLTHPAPKIEKGILIIFQSLVEPLYRLRVDALLLLQQAHSVVRLRVLLVQPDGLSVIFGYSRHRLLQLFSILSKEKVNLPILPIQLLSLFELNHTLLQSLLLCP